jgi:hypothetical protein
MSSFRYQVVAITDSKKDKLAAFADEFDALDYAKQKKRDLRKEYGTEAPIIDVEKISKGRPRSNNANAQKAINDYLSRKGTRRRRTIPQICEKYGLSVATFNRRLKEKRMADEEDF